MDVAEPALSLHCDPQTRELFAAYIAETDAAAPNSDRLREAVAASAWAGALLDEGEVKAFLDACQAGSVEATRIGRCEDARARVMLSADRMQAWLDLEPPQGGAPASLAQLQRALSEQGIVFGVNEAALEEAVRRGQAAQLLVAQGREPEPGSPARFEPLLQDGSRRRDDSDGDLVDYRELGTLKLVDPDTPLMRRTPAAPGRPGRDLLGQAVDPRAIPDLPFDAVSGAGTAPHDANLLVAHIAGLPSVGPRGVSVNPQVEVDDVDLLSGNIRFNGTVRVKGDIRAGMVVQVTGDVLVGGTVEAAEVMAGGHLLVAGGIIGRAEHGQAAVTARVRCRGDVQARFIEHADIEAAGQVRAEAGLRDSQVLAGDSVLIGGSGSVVGGRTAAHRLVRAPVLGSAWADPTEVQVGVNPFIDTRLAELRTQREQREAELIKLQQLLAYLERQPGGGQPGLRDKAQATLQACERALAGLSEETAGLVSQLELSDSASIEAQRKLHGGVRLLVGPSVLQLVEDRGPTRVRRVDGQIELG